MSEIWQEYKDDTEAWLKANDPLFPKFGKGKQKKKEGYTYMTSNQLKRMSQTEVTTIREELYYAN